MSGSGAISTSGNLAWGPQIGYIDFAPAGTPVAVGTNLLQGYAWSNSGGWINLAPTLAGVTNTCDGDLLGMAWSPAIGYIDFADARIDGNGYFQGRATTSGSGAILFQGDHFSLKTSRKPTCAGAGALTVLSPADNALTANATPTVSGGGAAASSKVHVTASSGASCVATVTSGGSWSCQISTNLPSGTATLSATEITSASAAVATKTIHVTINQ